MKKSHKSRRVLKVSGVIILILLLATWLVIKFKTYSSMEQAKEIMKQENVIKENNTIIITPEGDVNANFVFYQGGLVETEAYAVLGEKLAKKGIRVFIPYMPFNLAILNIDAFDKIYEEYNNDKDWYIGGHSLGGASASMYVDKSSKPIEGLILMGAYPSDSTDLSKQDIKVLSVRAINDKIMNLDNYNKSKELLPDSTDYVNLNGNHSNFGYYGFQKGDGESSISREEQHNLVVEEIIKLIDLD
ncbi:thioesterase [Vallitalea longa]|uniref:Thioesterase n=1 Tax=Vallitalea longa TaxID=2936439 RepID=A0A9W6DIV1_9FIRM|nr:alpha/beta hydrolase [Vallitalea longa]GKX32284.1 thioesterase [Vallitalea longa]